jgi:integrase
MLGHTSVSTTMRYLHTTTRRVSAQISPLDRLLFAEPNKPSA